MILAGNLVPAVAGIMVGVMDFRQQFLPSCGKAPLVVELVLGLVETALAAGMDREQLIDDLAALLKRPGEYLDDPLFGSLARSLASLETRQTTP